MRQPSDNKHQRPTASSKRLGVSFWLPSLFAAEAIPSAMVTFVSLLIFVQLGEGCGMSTLLAGLLTLPWVLKSFLREKVRRTGHYVLALKGIEFGIFLCLCALAFSFTSYRTNTSLVFAALFVLCFFCAWHELVARMYYERMLWPSEQRLYNAPKMFYSQSSVVVTYGAMILVVGVLEIFYHNRYQAVALSWSTAVYLLAGVYMLLCLYNLFVLKPSTIGDRQRGESLRGAVQAEVRVIDHIFQKQWWWAIVLALFFILLPQALMFHTRVLFLLAKPSDGGLGCSLQWIAVAQGTVGVIAFSAGLGWGFWLERTRHLFSRLWSAQVTLVLSPFVYYAMTLWPPKDLALLCVATFVAQGTFGFGLNACMQYVRYLSGERYRSTINYLYIPLIAFVMLLPVSASGWILEYLGFRQFFALDAFMALPALVAGYWAWWRVLVPWNRQGQVRK